MKPLNDDFILNAIAKEIRRQRKEGMTPPQAMEEARKWVGCTEIKSDPKTFTVGWSEFDPARGTVILGTPITKDGVLTDWQEWQLDFDDDDLAVYLAGHLEEYHQLQSTELEANRNASIREERTKPTKSKPAKKRKTA